MYHLLMYQVFLHKFSVCLFHESVSSISIPKYATDLTVSNTNFLRLVLGIGLWCCLAKQNKSNWVFGLQDLQEALLLFVFNLQKIHL